MNFTYFVTKSKVIFYCTLESIKEKNQTKPNNHKAKQSKTNQNKPWLIFQTIYFMVIKSLCAHIRAHTVPGSIGVQLARGLHIDHISLQKQSMILFFLGNAKEYLLFSWRKKGACVWNVKRGFWKKTGIIKLMLPCITMKCRTRESMWHSISSKFIVITVHWMSNEFIMVLYWR